MISELQMLTPKGLREFDQLLKKITDESETVVETLKEKNCVKLKKPKHASKA